MKCLLRYKWVKLPRNLLPPGKGIMGAWARLASRSAFRKGQAVYCGYINHVSAGEWAGGIVGLKSILGTKKRQKALETLDKLAELGYIDYALEAKTKKLAYQIKDWVAECSGAPCLGREAVYATDGYGFLCLPRNITQRLAEAHYQFDEADAWLDLWCHTVYQEPGNAFSHMAPAVQFGKLGAVLTLETLGRRWGWEKTKVWRFFRKHADAFPLYKLPGAFGCLIFNAAYPTGSVITLPDQKEVERILKEIRICGEKTYGRGVSDHKRLGKLVAWCSRIVMPQHESADTAVQNRVAPWGHNNTRAYFSLCRNCNHLFKDCQVCYMGAPEKIFSPGPVPRAGPSGSYGGFEYGTYQGIPLW